MHVISRRLLLAGCLTLALAGQARFTLAEDAAMTVSQAHDAALKGEVLLVDIRSPEEWRQTGVGEAAVAMTMHDQNFLGRLLKRIDGDRTRKIALICATGVRSNYVRDALRRIGFSHVIDVPEGMQGSAAGPGWLRTGLPMAKPSD